MSADRGLSARMGRPYPSTRNSLAARGRSLWTAIGVLVLTTVGIAQRGPMPSSSIQKGAREAVSAGIAQPQSSTAEAGTRTLPAPAQAQISAAIGGDDQAYYAVSQPGGFRLSNAQHSIAAEFTAAGVEFARAANRWGLALRGYGYGDALRSVAAAAPRAKANRIEYRRGPLVEWYVNGPLGLEQGFTIERAPGKSNGDPLTLTFALSGNLTSTVAADGRSLVLSKDGAVAMKYSGLTALDARGRELPARLEISGAQLRVRVDDSGAQYPITIDPYVQGQKLTTKYPSCDPSGVCDDGGPGDAFGLALAVSADGSTAVVGVPYKYTGALYATGAAYVFLRPTDGRGWSSVYPNYYKAKLLARDRLLNTSQLGVSVDISRDGETVVIGARGVSYTGGTVPPGAAYVFTRPTNGWGSLAIQTDSGKLTPTSRSNVNERGTFGTSVTISGDSGTIFVGSPEHMVNGVIVGAAYMFYQASGWDDSHEFQTLEGTRNSFYGYAVSLSDDGKTLAVGAWNEDPAGGDPTPRPGVVHVLASTSNPDSYDIFTEVARLKASDGIPGDRLGWAVSIDGAGSTIVAGAPVGSTDEYPAPHKGSAYVFTKPAGGWGNQLLSETAKFTASDGYPNDSFGLSVDVSVDGKTIIAGAFQRPLFTGTPTGPGAAYIFTKPAAGWVTSTENAKLVPTDAVVGMWFGYSTSITGDGSVAFVGAPWETIGYNAIQGAAYMFTAAPVASPSPSSVEFPLQPVGTTSAPKTVTLTNTGNAPLHVVSVHTVGSFLTTQNCVTASPIAAGASCAENVVFAPSSPGYFSGYLVFTDDSNGAFYTTQSVQLQGEARKLDSTTTITLSPNQALPGQNILVSFSVASEAGSTLSPTGRVTVEANTGESCWANTMRGSCTLTFATVGDRTISATYEGNSYFNPSMSADAQLRVSDFTISVSPASQTISGRKATFTVTVGVVNGFSGTVSLACAGGPPNTSCAMSPSSLSLAGSAKTAKATITLPVGVAPGTYVFGFTASSSGGSRGTTATLIVK